MILLKLVFLKDLGANIQLNCGYRQYADAMGMLKNSIQITDWNQT